jgi:hypothetical protein
MKRTELWVCPHTGIDSCRLVSEPGEQCTYLVSGLCQVCDVVAGCSFPPPAALVLPKPASHPLTLLGPILVKTGRHPEVLPLVLICATSCFVTAPTASLHLRAHPLDAAHCKPERSRPTASPLLTTPSPTREMDQQVMETQSQPLPQ